MKFNGKKILLLIFFLLGLFLVTKTGGTFLIFAETCDIHACDSFPSSTSDYASCLDRVKNQCVQDSSKYQKQADTFSGQIEQIKTQINLISIKIAQTEQKIATLGGRIGQLEDSLNSLSLAFSSRAVETYKLSRFENNFIYILTASDVSDAVSRYHYLQKIQEADRSLLERLQVAQTTYKGEKTDQENLQIELQSEKNNLSVQNKVLANSLAASLQQKEIADQILSQVEAMQNFVNSQGGASILYNQTYKSDWGSYYNQRDSQWGNMAMGYSGESVANVGCLISSAAMVATHYGKNLTPANFASDPTIFAGYSAYLLYNQVGVDGIMVSGVRIKRVSVGVNTSSIDNELAAGRPVIVGLYGGPAHFVVLKSGSNGNYTMNDPFVENGHDIPFTSKYSMDAITDVETVSVQ